MNSQQCSQQERLLSVLIISYNFFFNKSSEFLEFPYTSEFLEFPYSVILAKIQNFTFELVGICDRISYGEPLSFCLFDFLVVN